MNFFTALVITVCLVGGRGETFQETADPKSRQEPARKGGNVVLEYLEVIGSFMVPETNDDLDVLMGMMNSQHARKKPTKTLPELSTDQEDADPNTIDSENTNAKASDQKEADSKSKPINKKATHRRTSNSKPTSSKPTHGKPKTSKKSELLHQRGVLLLVGLVVFFGALCLITQKSQRKEKWQ